LHHLRELAERDRWALLEMTDRLPLREEPICDECLRTIPTARGRKWS
jgi:hypothetical protein